MLLIPCPWCGPRDETEFRYGGQAGIVSPPDPDALDDAAWAEYLFMRDNPKGPFRERWFHAPAAGAGSTSTRDTLTNEIECRPDDGLAPAAGGTGGIDRSDAPSPSRSTARPSPASRRHAGLRAAGQRRRRRRRGASTTTGRAGSSRPGRRSRTRSSRSAAERRRGADAPRDAVELWTGWRRGAPRSRPPRADDGSGRFDRTTRMRGPGRRGGAGPGGRGARSRQRRTACCSSTSDPCDASRCDGVQVLSPGDGARHLRPRLRARRRAPPDPAIEGRLWHIRAGRIVIATGAIERPIVFAGDDRPGVMLAAAAATSRLRRPAGSGSRSSRPTARPTPSPRPRARGVERGRRRRASRRRGRGTGGDDAGRLDSVTHRRPTARTTAPRPSTCCWCPAAGTRTSRCGASPRHAAVRRADRGVRPGRPGSRRIEAVGLPPATACRISSAAAPTRDGDRDAWATHYVDLQRDATVRRPAARARRRA